MIAAPNVLGREKLVTMQYTRLGDTGLIVSRLAFGVMTFGKGEGIFANISKVDEALSSRLVGKAMDAGVNYFNTADVYTGGQSEVLLGRAIASRRQDAIVATKGTGAAISAAGIPVKVVNKVKDGRPHIADLIKAGDIQLVYTTVDETRTAIADSRYIRTAALANRITYYTTMAGCEAATEALKHEDDLTVMSVQELHRQLH